MEFLYYFIGAIVAYIFGLLSCFLFLKGKVKKILKREYQKYWSDMKQSDEGFYFSFLKVVKRLKDRKDELLGYEEQYNQLKSEVHQYSMARVKDKNTSSNKINKEEIIEEENSYQVTFNIEKNELSNNIVDKQEKKIVIINQYYTVPDEDGSFIIENKKEVPEDRSYYKIEYMEGENVGKLFYRQGFLDKSALNQSDFILEPVCEIENEDLLNVQQIKMIEEGVVEIQDDKWVLKEKIKIKLL